MTFTLQLSRESIWSIPGAPHLRFIEAVPPENRPFRRECGCTKNIDRPALGAPQQVLQKLSFAGFLGDIPCTVSLDDLSVHFTLVPGDVRALGLPDGPKEARFYFRPTGVDLSFFLPEHGSHDHFGGSIYFGNNVDTSMFYHGHSPSKIVRLDKLQKDDVWAHQDIHQEAMKIFSRHPKGDGVFWREKLALLQAMQLDVAPYLENTDTPLKTLQERFLRRPDVRPFLRAVHDLGADLFSFYQRVRTTATYAICSEVEKLASIYPS